MRVEIGSELRHRVHLTLQSTHTLACVGLACVPNHTHYRHAHIGATLHKCGYHNNKKEKSIKHCQ